MKIRNCVLAAVAGPASVLALQSTRTDIQCQTMFGPVSTDVIATRTGTVHTRLPDVTIAFLKRDTSTSYTGHQLATNTTHTVTATVVNTFTEAVTGSVWTTTSTRIVEKPVWRTVTTTLTYKPISYEQYITNVTVSTPSDFVAINAPTPAPQPPAPEPVPEPVSEPAPSPEMVYMLENGKLVQVPYAAVQALLADGSARPVDVPPADAAAPPAAVLSEHDNKVGDLPPSWPPGNDPAAAVGADATRPNQSPDLVDGERPPFEPPTPENAVPPREAVPAQEAAPTNDRQYAVPVPLRTTTIINEPVSSVGPEGFLPIVDSAKTFVRRDEPAEQTSKSKSAKSRFTGYERPVPSRTITIVQDPIISVSPQQNLLLVDSKITMVKRDVPEEETDTSTSKMTTDRPPKFIKGMRGALANDPLNQAPHYPTLVTCTKSVATEKAVYRPTPETPLFVPQTIITNTLTVTSTLTLATTIPDRQARKTQTFISNLVLTPTKHVVSTRSKVLVQTYTSSSTRTSYAACATDNFFGPQGADNSRIINIFGRGLDDFTAFDVGFSTDAEACCVECHTMATPCLGSAFVDGQCLLFTDPQGQCAVHGRAAGFWVARPFKPDFPPRRKWPEITMSNGPCGYFFDGGFGW